MGPDIIFSVHDLLMILVCTRACQISLGRLMRNRLSVRSNSHCMSYSHIVVTLTRYAAAEVLLVQW